MRAVALLAVCAVLAGCSDEPSEAAMRTAVEAHTKRALSASGRSGFVAFDSFRKQGCVRAKDREGYYDCYYAATFAPRPGDRPIAVNGKGRFRQTKGGMLFQDMGAQPR